MNRLGAEQQLHSQANTTNYVELIMPNANLTLERAQELVNDAEQMALALIMLQNQSLKPDTCKQISRGYGGSPHAKRS